MSDPLIIATHVERLGTMPRPIKNTYEQSGLEENLPGIFGQWLRAEVKELSPYGKIFYGKQVDTEIAQERVPETPNFAATKETQKLENRVDKPNQTGDGQQLTAETTEQEGENSSPLLAIMLVYDKGTQKRGSGCLDEESTLVLYKEQMKEIEFEMLEVPETYHNLVRCKAKGIKLTTTKKGKRFCPYGANPSKSVSLDTSQLVDNPITLEEKEMKRALVASPNKPPSYT